MEELKQTLLRFYEETYTEEEENMELKRI